MPGVPFHIIVVEALVLGSLATAGLGTLIWILRWRNIGRLIPTLLVILIFAFLTQVPFPPRGGLVCPVPLTEPNWLPLGSIELLRLQWQEDWTWLQFLRQSLVFSMALNLVAGLGIGAVLSLHPLSIRQATLIGFAISLGLELTQLTAVWGLYPCQYRKFDADDLILNTLGTMLGVWAARRSR